jgi:UDP-N-acetylmuramate dehydrogenase
VEFLWDEPLARHTTFRIGGPVACLARPGSQASLEELLRFLRWQRIPHRVLGGGSNVLAPDEPWEAVVVQLSGCCRDMANFRGGRGSGREIYFGAGLPLSSCLQYCVRNGLTGLEFAVGIPASLGGAVRCNAGTPAGCMADALVEVDCLDTAGGRQRAARGDLEFGYRKSGMPGDWVIMGARLRLLESDPQGIKRLLKERMRERRRKQPFGLPSAGSVFKNPPGAFAGALIEKCGLKGLRRGDAEISTRHANWIVNRGRAQAADVLALVRQAEEQVRSRFGIVLEREVEVWEP